MDHAYHLSGFSYLVRPVRVDDAAYMLRLRLRQGTREYLHETSEDLFNQIEWIKNQLSSKCDYSFILEDMQQKRFGAFSIYEYDQDDAIGRIGRWIAEPATRIVPEFALLGYAICFQKLRLERVYAKIPVNNRAAIAFQNRIGARRYDDGEYTSLNGNRQQLVRFELARHEWPIVFAKLLPLAFRAYRSRRSISA